MAHSNGLAGSLYWTKWLSTIGILIKHDYDPEERKANQEFIKKHILFNKREIEKATKHLNDEMDEAAEEFYKTKKDKEKDDGLSL